MYRFQQMTNKLTRQFNTLTKAIPHLGAEFAFEQIGTGPNPLEFGQSARNRWSRSDLASAIGQDPHDGDPEVSVWPPTSRRV